MTAVIQPQFPHQDRLTPDKFEDSGYEQEMSFYNGYSPRSVTKSLTKSITDDQKIAERSELPPKAIRPKDLPNLNKSDSLESLYGFLQKKGALSASDVQDIINSRKSEVGELLKKATSGSMRKRQLCVHGLRMYGRYGDANKIDDSPLISSSNLDSEHGLCLGAAEARKRGQIELLLRIEATPKPVHLSPPIPPAAPPPLNERLKAERRPSNPKPRKKRLFCCLSSEDSSDESQCPNNNIENKTPEPSVSIKPTAPENVILAVPEPLDVAHLTHGCEEDFQKYFERTKSCLLLNTVPEKDLIKITLIVMDLRVLERLHKEILEGILAAELKNIVDKNLPEAETLTIGIELNLSQYNKAKDELEAIQRASCSPNPIARNL